MKFKEETIEIAKDSFKANLYAVTFTEGEFILTYIHSLNLSSYGHTLDESNSMMTKAVLPDFLESISKLSEEEVFDELKKYGWQKHKRKGSFSSAFIDKEGILQLRTLTLADFRRWEEKNC